MLDSNSLLQQILGRRQTNRILRLSFPNNDGPDAQLLPNKLYAVESMSRDFDYTVELLSDNATLALKEVQGKLMCVELVREDGSLRYFTGYVFSFSLRKTDGGVAFYQARLAPWLAYLDRFQRNPFLRVLIEYMQPQVANVGHGADIEMAIKDGGVRPRTMHPPWVQLR